MKNQCKTLITAVCIIFILAAALTLQVKADSTLAAPTKSDFGCDKYDPSSVKVSFLFKYPAGVESVRLQVFKNNKMIADDTFLTAADVTSIYTNDQYDLDYNEVYKYRIQYIKGSQTSAFSPFRYISVPKTSARAYSNKKGFIITTPKNKKIKKYEINIAKSKNGKFKKTATVKTNKKIKTKITKNYKKKANAYFYVYSYVKDGKNVYKSDLPSAMYIYVFK